MEASKPLLDGKMKGYQESPSSFPHDDDNIGRQRKKDSSSLVPPQRMSHLFR